VESQFNTLERPDNEVKVAIVDIDTDIDEVVERALVALRELTLDGQKVSA
jgi:gluconokinase